MLSKVLYKIFSIIYVLICVFLAYVYYFRPDSSAAITIMPAWVWVIPGLAYLVILLRVRKNRYSFGYFVFWIIFLLLFSEEPRSLLRSLNINKSNTQITRIITLNCAGGASEVSEEVIKYSPDIVLLQESPSRQSVALLCKKLYGKNGGYMYGLDASIIADGKVRPIKYDNKTAIYTCAQIELKNKRVVDIVSLRLTPPVFRLDYWNPECWKEQTQNRILRRSDLFEVKKCLDRLPDNIPVIIGGDFNAPAGDAIFNVIKERFKDSFKTSGVGWGNTVLNDFPVQRIDQIWVSKNIQVISAYAKKTQNSDHRMVVVELKKL